MTQVDDILDLECTLSLIHTLDFYKFTNKFFIELMVASFGLVVGFAGIEYFAVFGDDAEGVDLADLTGIANEAEVPAF